MLRFECTNHRRHTDYHNPILIVCIFEILIPNIPIHIVELHTEHRMFERFKRATVKWYDAKHSPIYTTI